ELGNHGFLQFGIRVIELNGIGPAVEVGIAAIGEHGCAGGSLNLSVVLRLSTEELRSTLHIVIRTLLNPAVVGGGVVGNEIEQQAHAVLMNAIAKALERFI